MEDINVGEDDIIDDVLCIAITRMRMVWKILMLGRMT